MREMAGDGSVVTIVGVATALEMKKACRISKEMRWTSSAELRKGPL